MLLAAARLDRLFGMALTSSQPSASRLLPPRHRRGAQRQQRPCFRLTRLSAGQSVSQLPTKLDLPVFRPKQPLVVQEPDAGAIAQATPLKLEEQRAQLHTCVPSGGEAEKRRLRNASQWRHCRLW